MPFHEDTTTDEVNPKQKSVQIITELVNEDKLAETSSEEIIWDRDAKYFYYDHGPLARTEIGHHKVQGIDHAYTVQGWLKAVNSNLLFEARDMGQDAQTSTSNLNKYVGKDEFGYSLGYFQNDYEAKSNSAADLLASLNTQSISEDLFNGNIKHMATAINHFDQTAQVMQYKYDQLNRLKTANSVDASHSGTWSLNTTSNNYRVNLEYDANGNIDSLARYDEIGALFDELGYTYDDAETNQLSEVEDGNASDTCDEFRNTSTYTYDEIGNLISETNNLLQTDITWSVTGKILAVTRNAVEDCPGSYPADLEFRYDPMGNRTMKIVKGKDSQGALLPSNEWERTYYMRDPQGNVMAVYKREDDGIYTGQAGATGLLDKLVVAEHNIYGSSRVGIKNTNKRVTALAYNITGDAEDIIIPETINPLDPVKRSLGQKQYELSNHLGNVLVTVSDKKLAEGTEGTTATGYKADVLFASDYYPFGMQMPGREFSEEEYRYGFQSQETDKEWVGGAVSYKYRVHDARIGRFLSVDPLAPDYPHNSPYAFSENSTIAFVELEGLERSRPAYMNENGGLTVAMDNVGAWEIAPHWLNTTMNLPPAPNFRMRERTPDFIHWNDHKLSIYGHVVYNEDNTTGSNDAANYGGKYGGQHGWDNGGKQIFFGTIGTILSGGLLLEMGAVGGLSAIATREGAFEVTNLMLSMDDISAGFFESGNSTVLSEMLNIDPEIMNGLKSVANATAFVKGLHGIVDDAIKAADKPNSILEFATILVDELELVLDIKTITEPNSENE